MGSAGGTDDELEDMISTLSGSIQVEPHPQWFVTHGKPNGAQNETTPLIPDLDDEEPTTPSDPSSFLIPASRFERPST